MSNYTTNDWRYYSPDELYHYGVLGQKWGVRHYQNEDGSLTPAGRAHYGVGERIKSNIEFSKRLKRIQKGVRNQNVVDRLERKGKTDTDKYRKYKALAETRLEDASEADIKLAKDLIKYSNKMGIAFVLSGMPGAAAYGVVESLASSGRERNALMKQTHQEYDEKKRSDQEAENARSPKKAIEDFYKDLDKAQNARTGEDHDRLERQADDRNVQRQNSIRNYYNEHKNEYMQNAKKNDTYDVDFLEAIQNKSMTKSQKIAEYDKYLDDPTDYWLNVNKHLDKYDDEY